MWQRRLTSWLSRRGGGGRGNARERADLRVLVDGSSATSRHTARDGSPLVASSSAVEVASTPSPAVDLSVDPFDMCAEDLDAIAASLRAGIKSYESSPVLQRAASYFFARYQDRFRPTAVLLMAKTSAAGRDEKEVVEEGGGSTWRRQRTVAEVAEMLHIASLLHDDVLDTSEAAEDRSRGFNQYLGNSVSLLAGDFLLARSVTALGDLRNCEVVEKMANVVEAFVHGEVLHYESPNATELFDDYLRKTFLKSAALLANAGSSVMVIGGRPPVDADAAFAFGKHLGMASRLAADAKLVAKVVAESAPVARKALKLSASGPVLHAAERHPELRTFLADGFREQSDRDVDHALQCIQSSGGIERTTTLALEHAQAAVDAVEQLIPSRMTPTAAASSSSSSKTRPTTQFHHPVYSALVNLVHRVVARPP